jgi:hypothetical protein
VFKELLVYFLDSEISFSILQTKIPGLRFSVNWKEAIGCLILYGLP